MSFLPPDEQSARGSAKGTTSLRLHMKEKVSDDQRPGPGLWDSVAHFHPALDVVFLPLLPLFSGALWVYAETCLSKGCVGVFNGALHMRSKALRYFLRRMES